MKRVLVPLLACSLFGLGSAGRLAAQLLPQDAWIIAGADFAGVNGGLFYLSPDRQTFAAVGNQSQAMHYANCVTIDPDTTEVFVGTLNSAPGGGNIYRLLIAGTSVINELQVTSNPPDSGSINGITLLDGEVWYVTDANGGAAKGNVGHVARTGGAPTNVITLASASINGLGSAITTNGRELFVGNTVSSGDPFNVWKLDPLAATPSLVGVILTPVVAFSNNPGQLGLGAEGKVFLSDFGGFFHLIDPVNATRTLMNTGARAPQSSGNGADFDPWTNQVAVIPGGGSTPREVHVFDATAGAWLTIGNPPGSFTGAFGTGVAAVSPRPFQNYGKGCVNSANAEPRCGSTGLPSLGNASFALTVRNAEASFPAVLMVGASRTQWFSIPLPLDLTGAGATGCNLAVAPLLFVSTVSDANGNASVGLSIPNDPALSGASIFSQWLLFSTVNSAGFITSDGGFVRLR